MTTEEREYPSQHLLETCWPVFEFVTNFGRQVKHGSTPAGEQVRYEALSALRDSEELARDEPLTERAWTDRMKAIVVYLIDYTMINTDWDGRLYWLDNPFETDRTILDHPQALGGEAFFSTCDELQREYELADRRDRRDKDELAAQLSVYFVCLRLGFKGQYHDRPQELGDYTRRLFTRLPAYASTRAKDMFPEAYRHNQVVKVDYNLGMKMTVILALLVFVLGGYFTISHFAWESAVSELKHAATTVESDRMVDPAATP